MLSWISPPVYIHKPIIHCINGYSSHIQTYSSNPLQQARSLNHGIQWVWLTSGRHYWFYPVGSALNPKPEPNSSPKRINNVSPLNQFRDVTNHDNTWQRVAVACPVCKAWPLTYVHWMAVFFDVAAGFYLGWDLIGLWLSFFISYFIIHAVTPAYIHSHLQQYSFSHAGAWPVTFRVASTSYPSVVFK